ncbi:18694_t:CDS:2, partial [Racocetra persica]
INPQRKKYERSHRTIFVSEQDQFLSLLLQHTTIPHNSNKKQSLYWLLNVENLPKDENNQVWVPLIPGESTNSIVDSESVSDIINQLINKGKLGSSVLVSTNIYLELVLNQSCPMCGNKEITSRKYTIKVIGLNIHITVICSNCGTQMNYNNETNCMDFSKAVAAAGLVGSMNREEIRTILSLIGLIQQNGIKQYFHNQDLSIAKLVEIANKNAEQNLHTILNHVNWKQFEQPIMKYYSKCIYAAITHTANSDIK